jgi:hypothetical protein
LRSGAQALSRFVPASKKKKPSNATATSAKKQAKKHNRENKGQKEGPRDDPFGSFCSLLFRARSVPFSSFVFIFPFSFFIRTCDQQRV